MANQIIEPEWVTPREWCGIFSCSRTTLYKQIALGKVDARKFGPTKTLVSVQSGRDLHNALPKVQASLPKPRRGVQS
jgi:hypothetical protein